MTLAIALLSILAAFIGVPLFAVFGGASMAFWSTTPMDSTSGVSPIYWAGNEFFTEKFADSPLTVTIPMFIFAGYLLAESGAPKRLVRLSTAWLGWMPGSLPIVCIVASAFFTTFTGGSGITIVAIGGLLLPALLAAKYGENFSLGVVTTSGALGLLFPPSIPIILYAIVAKVEISDMFVAGILPGILTLALLGGYSIFADARIKRPRTKFVLKDALTATNEAKWELALPLVLVLGLATGTLRIHEGAVFAAAYAFIVEVWIMKDISIKDDLPRIIRESMTMFGAILVILATAIGFTNNLVDLEVEPGVLFPDWIALQLGAVMSDPILFLLVLNVFLLLVGMFMDIFSATVVVVPLLLPITEAMARANPENAISPVHLGIVFILNLEIGYLHPPLGLNIFISSIRFDRSVLKVSLAVLPFIGFLLIALLITTYLPLVWPGFLLQSDEQTQEGGTPDGEIIFDDGGDTLDDLGGSDTLDDLGGSDTLDDLEGEPTLDDLEEPTLDDLEEPTLDDLEGGGTGEPTLDDLEGGGTGEPTLDDLEPTMDEPSMDEPAPDMAAVPPTMVAPAMVAPMGEAPAMVAPMTEATAPPP